MAFLGASVSFQYNNIDEDSVTYQVDKTGFDALRLRAVKKAIAVSLLRMGDEVDSLESLPELSTSPVNLATSTPIPKTQNRKPRTINRLPVISNKGPPCLKEDEARLIWNAKATLKPVSRLQFDEPPKPKPVPSAQLVQDEKAKKEEIVRREIEEAKKRLEEEAEKFKANEEKRRLQEELEKRREKEEAELKERTKGWIHDILASQKKYTAKYQELHSIVLISKDHESLRKNLVTNLLVVNSANEDILGIIDNCKSGSVNQDHVEKCRTYCDFISRVVEEAQAAIENLKVSEQAVESSPVEEEAPRVEVVEEDMMVEELKKEEEKKKFEEDEATKEPDPPDCVDMATVETPKEEVKEEENSVLVEYAKLRGKLEKLEESLKDFINDLSLKTFRSDCRKAVSTPVNAISPSSEAHLLDKYKKLSSLLNGKAVSIPGKTFTASSNPLGRSYCMLLLSKKFVEQGLEVVSKQKESAYPIAAVAVALWMDFPELGDLLKAQFHRSCPYLVPIYLEREAGESDEDYYKKLGFAKVSEDLNDFLKRMGGAARLYFAMMITRRRKGAMGKPLPLTAADGWEWIASILNEDPRSDITATLLYDALDVIGNLLLLSYRKQFRKILGFIKSSYLERIEKVTHGGMGPVARLREFVNTAFAQGRISVPQGVLPAHFW